MSEDINSVEEPATLIRGAHHDERVALRLASELWADATTNVVSPRRRDILRDKQNVINSFFDHVRKTPPEVTPADIKNWYALLEVRGLASNTIYCRLCHLSSFYEWLQREPRMGQYLRSNPVRVARPKAPKAYQTESVKALTDPEFAALLSVVSNKAASGNIVGMRDYALLLFYVTTGMRRSEVINLRGRHVELQEEVLLVSSQVKGGDYAGREIREPKVRSALVDYLVASERLNVLKTDGPLWTRHDRAGRPGAPLTSHAFALNFKRYAKEAGINKAHLHQTRHTFARMVAEDSGSITATQDALGHKNAATTRVYVQRISVRKDRHSEQILRRFESAG